MQFKIDFKKLKWEVPFECIKHKYLDQENIRVRLVDYWNPGKPMGMK